MSEYTTTSDSHSAGGYFKAPIPAKRYINPNSVGPAPLGGKMEAYKKWAELYEKELAKSKLSGGTWADVFVDEDGPRYAPTPPKASGKIPLTTEDRIQVHKAITEMLTAIEQLMGAVVEQDEQPNFELVTQATEQGKKLLKRVV